MGRLQEIFGESIGREKSIGVSKADEGFSTRQKSLPMSPTGEASLRLSAACEYAVSNEAAFTSRTQPHRTYLECLPAVASRHRARGGQEQGTGTAILRKGVGREERYVREACLKLTKTSAWRKSLTRSRAESDAGGAVSVVCVYICSELVGLLHSPPPLQRHTTYSTRVLT